MSEHNEIYSTNKTNENTIYEDSTVSIEKNIVESNSNNSEDIDINGTEIICNKNDNTEKFETRIFENGKVTVITNNNDHKINDSETENIAYTASANTSHKNFDKTNHINSCDKTEKENVTTTNMKPNENTINDSENYKNNNKYQNFENNYDEHFTNNSKNYNSTPSIFLILYGFMFLVLGISVPVLGLFHSLPRIILIILSFILVIICLIKAYSSYKKIH